LYLHTMGTAQYITDTTEHLQPEIASVLIGYILPSSLPSGCPYCGAPLKVYEKNQQSITTSKAPPMPPFEGVTGTTLGYLIKLQK